MTGQNCADGPAAPRSPGGQALMRAQKKQNIRPAFSSSTVRQSRALQCRHCTATSAFAPLYHILHFPFSNHWKHSLITLALRSNNLRWPV